MNTAKKLILIFSGLSLMILFQNCSGDFEIPNNQVSNLESVSSAAVSRSQIGKSVMITNNNVLDRINDNFDLGYLLGQVGRMENNANPGATRSVGRWVAQIFELAQNQQDEYVDRGQFQLGRAPLSSRYMKRVLEQWTDRSCNKIHTGDSNFRAIKQFTSPAQLRSKTFRLLAVVNRMDLAGEYDDRLTNSATRVPRFLGEVHLVYGLIDRTRNYENSNCSRGDSSTGKAYPMTFVVSYRLPVIRKLSSGSFPYARASSPSLFSLGENSNQWKNKMKLWAEAWENLASTGNNSAHANRLAKALELAVRPENFLSLKTNTEVRNDVYELREWYIFRSGQVVNNIENANGLLIPRKLRREPYPCLNNSHMLTKQVQHYWRPAVNDLDMTTRRYDHDNPDDPDIGSTPTNADDHTRSGYALMRDHTRLLIDDLDILQERRSNYYWSDNCGRTTNQMPFGMHTGNSRNDPPTGDKDVDTLMGLAPFGRVNGDGRIWRLRAASLDGVSASQLESMRHAFAIRTCTGCHSQEGATKGFHIFPRLSGNDSSMSNFLTGGGEFSQGGKTYNYNVLEQRRMWLNKFMSRDKELYNTLKLPERNN